jgi:hypothetical protein
MTHDDVLFGNRLQLFDLAARTTVSHAQAEAAEARSRTRRTAGCRPNRDVRGPTTRRSGTKDLASEPHTAQRWVRGVRGGSV